MIDGSDPEPGTIPEKGTLVAPADTHRLRFVTHRHIGAADVDAVVGAFAALWKKK